MKSKKIILTVLLLFVCVVGSAIILDGITNKRPDKTVQKEKTEAEQYQNESVWMPFAFFPANYAQVSEGDYYYLRRGKEGTYTIFKNKGEELVTFTLCEKGKSCYITGFARYKGMFYLLVEDHDKLQARLQRVDMKNGNLVTLKGDIGLLGFDDLDYSHRYYLYNNYLIAKNVINGVSVTPLFSDTDTTTRNPTFSKKTYQGLADSEGEILEKAYFTYHNGEMYFGWQNGINVSLYKGKIFGSPLTMKKFASYEANSTKKTDLVITFDEDYMYSQNWAISRKNGETKKFAKGNVTAVSTTSEYIFYIDETFRIHRVDKKDFKDTMISDIKAAGIDCVDNGIYVREYDKILFDAQKYLDFPDELQGTADDYALYSNAIYYMDFNGEHVETVVGAYTDVKDIIGEENQGKKVSSDNNFSDRTGEKLSDILQNVDFSKQGAGTIWHNMASFSNGNVQTDGHFYYITCDNKDDIDDEYLDEENVTYTVYRDQGEKVKTFTTKGDLKSCILYQNRFYLDKTSFDQLTLDRTYQFQRLEEDGNCTDLTKYTYNINDILSVGEGHSFIIYEDKVYRCEIIDGSTRLVRVKEDGSDEILTQQIIGLEGFSSTDYMVVDGKMYYAVSKRGKTLLYYIDLSTGEQVKFYSYEKESSKGNSLPTLSMDSDFIYCGKDRISIQTGEVKHYSLNDYGTFVSTKQYIFYVDKKHQLHRVDKKTDRDKMITTTKITQVNATEEGLFVEKYDKELEKKIDADLEEDRECMWYNYYPANQYYMDFDGKNMKKIS